MPQPIKIKRAKTPCALLAKSSKALLHGKGRRRLHSAAFAARRKRAVQASSDVVYSEMPLNASLHELFDTVVTQENVLRSKPDPFCYNMVIERFGVDLSRCIIFEDSASGIAAALASGCQPFCVMRFAIEKL